MKTSLPSTIEINPAGNTADASILWLHGLGANAQDFVALAERFRFADNHRVRFVFPNAPYRAITVNRGMRMRAWYDVKNLEFIEGEDEKGIQESAQLIDLLIERELSLGIESKRIVLGGFSQGGAMSLYAGLRFPKALNAVISLSGYMPLANTFETERHHSNQNTPLFVAHGLFDPVVPFMMGEAAKQQLTHLNYPLEWHTYSMQHAVAPEEIEDIGDFLKKNL